MRAISFALIALLAGCATYSSHIITGKTRPATDPAQVRIFTKAPAQYEEIAVIEANSGGSLMFLSDQHNTDLMLRRLKEESARLGGNGVLLTSSGNVDLTYHKGGKGRAIYVIQE